MDASELKHGMAAESVSPQDAQNARPARPQRCEEARRTLAVR